VVNRDQQAFHEGGDISQPEGWVLPKISEIFTINYGKGLKKTGRKNGSVPVYGSNGVVGEHHKPLTEGPTIVIGRKGTVGAVSFSNVPCWPIDTTYFIDVFHGLVPRFIFYALRSLNLGALDTSTAIPGLNRNDIYKQRISLPPIPEQRRIVAKIEELLARVNDVRDRLTKVKEILKRFRQSVLSAACSGQLTADWRKLNSSKEHGHALLKTILKEKNGEIGKVQRSGTKASYPNNHDFSILPDSWAWSTVGQTTKNFDGHRVPIKGEDRENRQGIYPYYGASGIIDNINDYLFEGDFLLIAEDGANLLSRSTPIAFRASGKFWVNNHAHVLQTYAGVPLQYLECYLNGIDLQEYVTGSAQPKLTQASMNHISVPLPPLAEQYEIIHRVESLFNLADAIEKHVEAASVRAEKMTQAILAKAFRGELVPTEAELARMEGRDYEPASSLLVKLNRNLKN